MSAFRGKADVNQGVAGCPLIAISGHLLVRRVLRGALGPDRLAACLGDQSMRLPQVRKARSLPPRAHDDTGPGRQPARRSEIDKRGRGPEGPCPGQYLRKMIRREWERWESNHPGRSRASLLAVARNDHVTPPSVYWQVTPPPSTRNAGGRTPNGGNHGDGR